MTMQKFAGYMVLTKDRDGQWQADWDGLVHWTHGEATEALEDAARLGDECILATLVYEEP